MPTFNLFEALSLVFLFQASTYILFLIRRQMRKADVILAAFILILVIAVLNLFLRTYWPDKVPYFYFEYVSLLAIFQYLYIEAVVKRKFSFATNQLYHLSGFAFVVIFRLFLYCTQPESHAELLEKILAMPLFIYTYFYLFLSIKKINQFHQAILLTQSTFEQLNLKWLKYELIILGVYFMTLGVESASIFVDLGNLYELIILCSFLSILLFINVLVFKSLRTPIATQGITKDDIKIAENENIKYKSSNLSATESRERFVELTAFIEKEKPYRQFALSLEELSKLVNLPPAVLSQIINENAEKNFNDFINSYRVEEAKHLLAASENQLLIKEVMYECGFQSTSTFNASFKKITGLSPSAYQKK